LAHGRADKCRQFAGAALKNMLGQAKCLEQRTGRDVANARREAKAQPSLKTFTRKNHAFSSETRPNEEIIVRINRCVGQGFFKLAKIEVLLN
jgi:hypothetical protein